MNLLTRHDSPGRGMPVFHETDDELFDLEDRPPALWKDVVAASVIAALLWAAMALILRP